MLRQTTHPDMSHGFPPLQQPCNPVLPGCEIRLYRRGEVEARLPRLTAHVQRNGPAPLSLHPAWTLVLAEGLGHTPFILEAEIAGELRGFLALALVRSPLFGRFLVSMPYLNYGGVQADDPEAAGRLVDRAVDLAAELRVRYLELRHSGEKLDHPRLDSTVDTKVIMRLTLPGQADALWNGLTCKVRNQVRKGMKAGLDVTWGGRELLPEFHRVFSHNMRDLGTPSYGRAVFAAILARFPHQAELCVVRKDGVTAAGALLLHGWGITEVPSASCLRAFNCTNANSLMYWHLLQRAIGRGQRDFDFGRSTPGSGTFAFKRHWGALPLQSFWQYHLREGTVGDMRPDNPRYQRMIALWQKLPVGITRLIGPPIIRGIP